MLIGQRARFTCLETMFDAGALENALESRIRAIGVMRTADHTTRRTRPTTPLWRGSARLSESGGGEGLPPWPSLLVPVSARAAATHHRRRAVRIVQIDTPETFGRRAVKKRLRELLDSAAAEAGHQADDDRSRGPRSPAPPTPPASGLDRRPHVGLILAGSPRARRSLISG